MARKIYIYTYILVQTYILVSAARAEDAAAGNDYGTVQQHISLNVGILLSELSGYQAWLDAESVMTALMQPATLRAAENTTWSFEVFCAETTAATGSCIMLSVSKFSALLTFLHCSSTILPFKLSSSPVAFLHQHESSAMYACIRFGTRKPTYRFCW
jgi:hypothetical protein